MRPRVDWLEPVPAPRIHDTYDQEGIRQLARDLYWERRHRSRYFDDDLFGEPSWDILLDLYVAHIERRRIPTTSACIGSNVPPTTALRWLRLLETRGFVERQDDSTDGRRTFVALSDKGLSAMEAFLGAIRARFMLDAVSRAEAEAVAAGERLAAE